MKILMLAICANFVQGKQNRAVLFLARKLGADTNTTMQKFLFGHHISVSCDRAAQ